MEQLVWYNFRHNCFKSKFGYLPYEFKVGNRNGFDEELVCTYDLLSTSKSSFLSNSYHFLKKLFKRKEKIVYVYIDNSRYPFWRR